MEKTSIIKKISTSIAFIRFLECFGFDKILAEYLEIIRLSKIDMEIVWQGCNAIRDFIISISIFDNLIFVIVNVNAIFIWKIVTQISKGHHVKLMMIAELMGYVSGHIHIHPKRKLLHHFCLQVLPSNFCYRRCKCKQKPKKCKEGKLCKTEDDCGLNDAGKCVLK